MPNTEQKNDTTNTKQGVPFRPFKWWKGPRKRCTNSVNSDKYFAATYLPVPVAKTLEELEQLCQKIYKRSVTQMMSRGVSSVNYSSDGAKDGTRKWHNDKMREGQCDLDKVKGCPPDKMWQASEKEEEKQKKEDLKMAKEETGWSDEDMIAYMKKHPKK